MRTGGRMARAPVLGVAPVGCAAMRRRRFVSTTTKHPTLSSQQRAVDPLGTPLLVAVPDAARLLGIGTIFAWELVRAGDLPSVKLGRRVLVPRAALERLAGTHMSEDRQQSEDAPTYSSVSSRQDTA